MVAVDGDEGKRFRELCPVADARKSWRNRNTSLRNDVTVLRLRDSTPAYQSSFSSRATSDW